MIIEGLSPMPENNPFKAGQIRKRRKVRVELNIEELFYQLSLWDICDLVILKKRNVKKG